MSRKNSDFSFPGETQVAQVARVPIPTLSSACLVPLSSHPTVPPFKLKKKIFLYYWSIVDLRCCVNFCCPAKWLSYRSEHSFSYFFCYGLSEDIESSLTCCTAGLGCSSILYIYTSLHLLIPDSRSCPPTPCQAQMCSLWLWICFWFITMFIYVVF